MNALEIIDTAVKVGLGALIAALSGFGVEIYRRKSERDRQAEERYRQIIEKPVVEFVDEMLILMSKSYWDRADGSEIQVDERLEVFRQREASIEARISAMKNPALSESFRLLDQAFTSFRAEINERSLDKARSLMKEAQGHAGQFLQALYPLPK